MLEEIINEAEQKVRAWIDENAKEVLPEQLGLNAHGGRVYVGDIYVIVERDAVNRFEYYNGWNYVNQDQISDVGRWRIYVADMSNDDDRVAGAVDFWQQSQDE